MKSRNQWQGEYTSLSDYIKRLPSVLCKSARRIRQDFSDQRSQLLTVIYSMHKGRKMAGLNLNIADEMWCVWLKGVYASDYQQTEQTLLAILVWLTQPRIKNLMRFTPHSPFPYHKNTVNSWVPLSANSIQRRRAVMVMNVDEKGKSDKCYTIQNAQTFPESLSNDEDYEVFFHGTRHTSAQNIIDDGIDLAKGKRERDFSSGDGFYLCKDFDEALTTRWAKKRPPCSAVLVFQVTKAKLTELRRDAGRCLDLQYTLNRCKKERWQEVVSLFRTAEGGNQNYQNDNWKSKNDEKELRKLRGKSFIEGPIASEGQNFSKPELISAVRDDSYQLCIRSDTCAELFNQSLHSAVFFPEKKKS